AIVSPVRREHLGRPHRATGEPHVFWRVHSPSPMPAHIRQNKKRASPSGEAFKFPRFGGGRVGLVVSPFVLRLISLDRLWNGKHLSNIACSYVVRGQRGLLVFRTRYRT